LITTAATAAVTTTDWLWVLHPALMVAVVYPLLGAVLHLARHTRARRLGLDKPRQPAGIGTEHKALGSALAAAVVLIVLIALAVVIATHPPSPSAGGGRMVSLTLIWLGSAAALASLLKVRKAPYRAVFALLTWSGLLALGAQPEVWRLSDNPLTAGFWQSHYWGGMGLVGLLLFSVAARPEIQRSLLWRRLHLAANLLATLIFLAQGISGSRDLLEIPLSWQKPVIYSCDAIRQICPAAQPPG
jgi:hypothetical protein